MPLVNAPPTLFPEIDKEQAEPTKFRVTRKLALVAMLHLIRHLRSNGWDKTFASVFSANLDRMNRYAMIN